MCSLLWRSEKLTLSSHFSLKKLLNAELKDEQETDKKNTFDYRARDIHINPMCLCEFKRSEATINISGFIPLIHNLK